MTTAGLTRRTVLALGGVVVLTACTPAGGATTPSVPASAVSSDPARRGVRELIESASFLVAHRGSGDNWPEHSLTAYRNSLAAGADAVEISVCATSDGVLVCHHDLSARRTLGLERDIADMTWSQLQSLQIDARTWLGPQTPLEPVSTLEDALAEIGDEALVFIEDKQGTNSSALLDLLDLQPRSTERFVWKQWAPASQVTAAKARGYLA